MGNVLFNFHDVVLLLTVFFCFVTAIIYVNTISGNIVAKTSMAMLCVASAAIPLDILISFGAGFRPFAIDHFPHLFYVFEFGYWLQGPFLLIFTRSLLFSKQRYSLFDACLVAPYVLFFMHQVIAYHSLPANIKAEMLNSHSIQQTSFSVYYIVFLRELFRFGVCLYAVYSLQRYFSQLEKPQADHAKVELRWLQVLIYGLAAIAGLSLFTATLVNLSLYGFTLPINVVGLSGNYLTCLLFMGVIIAGKKPVLVESIDLKDKQRQSGASVKEHHVIMLEDAMTKDKLYLDGDMTLESLARHLDVSPRTVSNVINRHYNCNFFEFVNSYRINEAKTMIRDEKYAKCSILDIMHQTGFNSKATFNSFFKKKVGMTPREFRKSAEPETSYHDVKKAG